MSISVEKAVIAKMIKSGERFEILVDPVKALELKQGKDVPLDDLLAVQQVFEDSKKGLKPSEDKINKIFGTNEIGEIVKKIIKQGEIQLTTEQRREMTEEKRKRIATIISRKGINPQTNAPHPVERILNAMEQAKVKIDLNKPSEQQIDDILKSIQSIIPIRFEKLQIAVKVPANYAGKVANVIRNFGTIKKEEWKDNYICLIEIPAGLQQDVYDKLNSLTKGEVEVKIVKKEEI